MLILAIVLIACNHSEKQGVHKDLWTFDASKNNPQLDDLCTPIIKDYLELLKSLSKNDTANLFAKASGLILKLDTVPNFYITKDTAMFQQFKNGILNIQDELQGVILEQYPEDVNIAMNMVSVHLLHLLGKIGYNKQGVYIFNTNGNNASEEEEGLLWISINKKSNNPYINIGNELVNANYSLQEN